MVVHTCKPSSQEDERRGPPTGVQLRKQDPISKESKSMLNLEPNSSESLPVNKP